VDKFPRWKKEEKALKDNMEMKTWEMKEKVMAWED